MVNSLDFIDIDNCVIDAKFEVKSLYHDRLKNIGLSSDFNKNISDQNNSYLMIFDKACNVRTVKNSIKLLRKNSLARNRFIIFEISSKHNFLIIFQCLIIAMLFRSNPLLFYKHKSKDVSINLFPDSSLRVLGCSKFKSAILFLRYLLRNLFCIYACNLIILELR